MNTYLIEHKIKAIANLGFEFEQGDYRFTWFDPDNKYGGEEWLAIKQLEAPSFHDATLRFRLELIPILDGLSVLTQCSFTLIAMSYLARRLNENASEMFFLYVARDRKTVGMQFWDKSQLEDLNGLLRIENPVALHYLRESNNASTTKSRLSMLLSAAEALAGQKPRIRKCPNPACGHEETISTSNRDLLEEILGTETYQKLYVKNGGALRHKLAHGSVTEDKDIVEVLQPVYEKIVLEYLPKICGLKSMEKIVAAPRSFTSFEHGGLFVIPKHPEATQLRVAEAHWNKQDVLEPVDEPPGY